MNSEEKPLFFKKWRHWYVLVLGTLALIIFLLEWAARRLR
jgi:hypothetical protein